MTILEDALNDFSTVQKDVVDIERAMDKAIRSMDAFKDRFERFLEIEDGFVKERYSHADTRELKIDLIYTLDGMYDDFEKIWRNMANYEKHLSKMGYAGFSKDMKIEMSGIAGLMNRMQEYKHKLEKYR
jgi:hypothetical protein